MAYTRKTKDVWLIQGFYTAQYGWETLTTEDTRDDARRQLKCYNDNETTFPHRMRVKREKVELETGE